MASVIETLIEAMEQAAISGLCREGQLEIGLQEARKLKPDLSHSDQTALVETAYAHMRESE